MDPLTVNMLCGFGGLVIGLLLNHERRIGKTEDAQRFCPHHFKPQAID